MADASASGDRLLGIDRMRDGLSAADNAALGTFKTAHDADDAGGAKPCGNKSVIAVKAVFDSASQSCGVQLWFFATDSDGNEDNAAEPWVSKVQTLEASSGQDGASEYPSKTVLMVNPGFPLFRMKLVTAPGSGTVDLYGGVK